MDVLPCCLICEAPACDGNLFLISEFWSTWDTQANLQMKGVRPNEHCKGMKYKMPNIIQKQFYMNRYFK